MDKSIAVFEHPVRKRNSKVKTNLLCLVHHFSFHLYQLKTTKENHILAVVIMLELLNFCMLKSLTLTSDSFGQVQNKLLVLKQILLLLNILTEQKGKILEMFEQSSDSSFVTRVND